MKTAASIPFHPQQCPVCQHYVKAGERCRAYKDDSFPRPYLAAFSGETDKPCRRFQRILAPLSPSQPFETAPGMKICPGCASVIIQSAKNCPHCGAWFKITIKGYCPNCESVMQATDSRWCCRCGSELTDLQMESMMIEHPASAMPIFMKINPVQPVARKLPGMIHCHRCNSENSSTMTRCRQCGANLLPAKSPLNRLAFWVSDIIDGLF
ncbi:MAG: hypothetical protein GYA34_12430 [Chloroflexi bacterium]|nr:hypothetical protein [Chloroflexota bacterium]